MYSFENFVYLFNVIYEILTIFVGLISLLNDHTNYHYITLFQGNNT